MLPSPPSTALSDFIMCQEGFGFNKKRRLSDSSLDDMTSKLFKVDLSDDTNGYQSGRLPQSSIRTLTSDDSLTRSTQRGPEPGPASTEDHGQSICCNSHTQVLDGQEVAVLCVKLYTAIATHLELTVSEKEASEFTFS
jgi:hypothetical protein